MNVNKEPIYGRTGPADIYGSTKPQMKHPIADRGGIGSAEYRGQTLADELMNDFSDNDETPLTEPIYNGSTRSYMETKGWDVFRTIPPEQESGSESFDTRYIGYTVKFLKVLAYIVCFLVVLGGCVISKATVLFMTSQIRPQKSILHCNLDLERDKSYQAEISLSERVAWIWCLFFVFVAPEMGTFIRSTRITLFKTMRVCSGTDFLVVFFFEALHTVGLSLLVFVALPELDVVKGAMITNCVAFIPAFFGLLSRNNKESGRLAKSLIDVVAIACQVSGFFIWPIVENGTRKSWTVAVAILLISFGWWENYVDRRSKSRLIKKLAGVKERLTRTRYFTYMFVSFLKMCIFFSSMLLFLYINGTPPSAVFTEFNSAFSGHVLNVTEVHANFKNGGGQLQADLPSTQLLQEIIEIRSSPSTPIYVLLIQMIAAYLAYVIGKFACKIVVQGFSYAFPVIMTVPLTVIGLIAGCGLRNEDSCYFRETLPDYLYWECPGGDFLSDFITNQHAWIWIFWLLSQTWITFHIWVPKNERLAPTEKLFVRPWYCSFLIDQSLGLNRRRDDIGEVKTEDLELDRVGMDENDISQYYETISIHTDSSNTNVSKGKSSDSITRIYACATMWHETKEEMMEMLKSLFRMDEDQSARRVAQKYLKVVDSDYYEFETHIFFDDAFEIADANDDWMQVNDFVHTFVESMDEAASYVHQTNIRLRPPRRVPTPYGGRLVYVLPGKTKMYVHMKDKSRIRHKKRWSQCMYMYYLLGHRLMELPISVDRKEILAENTYILTLDGDIDFQPPAVSLLVDLMKKNKNLGAACGRIHPVGGGPMAWYQLFEYAIGHWLQKATEHMIGCVMCSPGCFSLFRGKALMDDNVMRRYTTKSEAPEHYVQYDQGEDRWLCTLLLQRGYRVEYSAASDAYTHCPTGFNEFFNQRRRWVPSTIANIFDLLRNYKATVKINENISLPYIFYQAMLMTGTIIGPGTIFLMLVGAFVAAFKISNWYSFYYNLIPIVVYTGVCLTCKSNIQLALSAILSTMYALIMMAVIVGTALQLGEDGIGSPSAIFLISMIGSMTIAAVLHPQEFKCIISGIIYLLCIPAMYLLLIIYSITNLNVVSWGTREVPVKKTKAELEAEKKQAALSAQQAKKQKSKEGFLSFLNNGGSAEDQEAGISFSLGNILTLNLFTNEKDDKQQIMRLADSLDSINKRLDHIESSVDPTQKKTRRKSSRMSTHGTGTEGAASEKGDMDDGGLLNNDESDEDGVGSSSQISRDTIVNPFWLEDKQLGRGAVDYLSGAEVSFWKDLIKQYLYPLDANKAQQDKIAAGLKELRNKAVFFFSMFNALFVLIVFMLTLHKDTLYINWPFGVKENITYTEDEHILVTKEYLHLEPIGIVLVFFFFLIIAIQFIAMLFHRFGTLSHILASTELNCFSRKNEILSDEALIEKNAVAIVKAMQKLRGIDGEYDSDSATSNRLAHRKTIHMLEKNRHKKRAIGTLDVAFKKRFLAFTGAPGENGPEGQPPMQGGKPYGGFYAGKGSQTPILGSRLPIRRETMKTALEHHFEHVEERKQSKMQTLGASNPHNNNKDKHRQNTKVTGDTIGEIFNVGSGGNDNPGFVDGINPGALNAVLSNGGSSNTDDEASSTTRNSSTKYSRSREHSHPPPATNSLMWKERRRNDRAHDMMGGDGSTSTTSKM